MSIILLLRNTYSSDRDGTRDGSSSHFIDSDDELWDEARPLAGGPPDFVNSDNI